MMIDQMQPYCKFAHYIVRISVADGPATVSVTKELRNPWLRDGAGSTPFSTIRRMMRYVTKVAFSETSLPRIEFNDERTTCSVNSKKIELANIAVFYNELLNEAQTLFNELTDGHSTDLPITLDQLFDDKTIDTPGYSFVQNKKQNLQSARFKGITSHLKKPGFVIKQEGELVWNHVMMETFMGKAHRLNEILMTLMHIGGGQPARGQEFFTLTYRNQQNVQRSLFASNGDLCWILSYSKVSFIKAVLCSHTSHTSNR